MNYGYYWFFYYINNLKPYNRRSAIRPALGKKDCCRLQRFGRLRLPIRVEFQSRAGIREARRNCDDCAAVSWMAHGRIFGAPRSGCTRLGCIGWNRATSRRNTMALRHGHTERRLARAGWRQPGVGATGVQRQRMESERNQRIRPGRI